MLTVLFKNMSQTCWDMSRESKLDFRRRIFDDMKRGNILYITASSAELQHIKKIFSIEQSTFATPNNVSYNMYSIPIVVGVTYMEWWGDIALTILSNL